MGLFDKKEPPKPDAQAEALAKQVTDLESQVRDLKKQLLQRIKTEDDLREQLKAAQAGHPAQPAEASPPSDVSADAMRDLQTKLQEVEGQRDRLLSVTERMQEQKDSIEVQLLDAQEAAKTAEKQRDEATDKQRAAEQRLQDADTALREATETVRKLTSDNSRLEQTVQSLRDTLAAQGDGEGALQKKLLDMQEKLDAQAATASTRESDFEARVAQLQSDLSGVQSGADAARHEAETLRKEVDSLKSRRRSRSQGEDAPVHVSWRGSNTVFEAQDDGTFTETEVPLGEDGIGGRIRAHQNEAQELVKELQAENSRLRESIACGEQAVALILQEIARLEWGGTTVADRSIPPEPPVSTEELAQAHAEVQRLQEQLEEAEAALEAEQAQVEKMCATNCALEQELARSRVEVTRFKAAIEERMQGIESALQRERERADAEASKACTAEAATEACRLELLSAAQARADERTVGLQEENEKLDQLLSASSVIKAVLSTLNIQSEEERDQWNRELARLRQEQESNKAEETERLFHTLELELAALSSFATISHLLPVALQNLQIEATTDWSEFLQPLTAAVARFQTAISEAQDETNGLHAAVASLQRAVDLSTCASRNLDSTVAERMQIERDLDSARKRILELEGNAITERVRYHTELTAFSVSQLAADLEALEQSKEKLACLVSAATEAEQQYVCSTRAAELESVRSRETELRCVSLASELHNLQETSHRERSIATHNTLSWTEHECSWLECMQVLAIQVSSALESIPIAPLPATTSEPEPAEHYLPPSPTLDNSSFTDAELSLLRCQNDELRTEIDRLYSERATIELQLTDERAAKAALHSELIASKSALQEEQTTISELRKAVLNAQQSLVALENAADGQSQDLRHAVEACLSGELASLEAVSLRLPDLLHGCEQLGLIVDGLSQSASSSRDQESRKALQQKAEGVEKEITFLYELQSVASALPEAWDSQQRDTAEYNLMLWSMFLCRAEGFVSSLVHQLPTLQEHHEPTALSTSLPPSPTSAREDSAAMAQLAHDLAEAQASTQHWRNTCSEMETRQVELLREVNALLETERACAATLRAQLEELQTAVHTERSRNETGAGAERECDTVVSKRGDAASALAAALAAAKLSEESHILAAQERLAEERQALEVMRTTTDKVVQAIADAKVEQQAEWFCVQDAELRDLAERNYRTWDTYLSPLSGTVQQLHAELCSLHDEQERRKLWQENETRIPVAAAATADASSTMRGNTMDEAEATHAEVESIRAYQLSIEASYLTELSQIAAAVADCIAKANADHRFHLQQATSEMKQLTLEHHWNERVQAEAELNWLQQCHRTSAALRHAAAFSSELVTSGQATTRRQLQEEEVNLARLALYAARLRSTVSSLARAPISAPPSAPASRAVTPVPASTPPASPALQPLAVPPAAVSPQALPPPVTPVVCAACELARKNEVIQSPRIRKLEVELEAANVLAEGLARTNQMRAAQFENFRERTAMEIALLQQDVRQRDSHIAGLQARVQYYEGTTRDATNKMAELSRERLSRTEGLLHSLDTVISQISAKKSPSASSPWSPNSAFSTPPRAYAND